MKENSFSFHARLMGDLLVKGAETIGYTNTENMLLL
jgi:hypothetical protein